MKKTEIIERFPEDFNKGRQYVLDLSSYDNSLMDWDSITLDISELNESIIRMSLLFEMEYFYGVVEHEYKDSQLYHIHQDYKNQYPNGDDTWKAFSFWYGLQHQLVQNVLEVHIGNLNNSLPEFK